MKQILASAAFVALMAGSGAVFAGDPGSAIFNITGEVGSITNLPTPTPGTGTNASASGNTVNIQDLADPTTAKLKDSSIAFTFSNVNTNYAAKIGLYSSNGGLKNGSLLNLPYKAVAAATTNTSLNNTCVIPGLTATSHTCVSPATTGAILVSETITLTISTDDADYANPLPAGTYTDTLTLKIGTNV